MEESLGCIIRGLQRRITGLERELSTLLVREIDDVTSGLFAGIKPNVAGAVRSADELAAEVLHLIDLSSYAKSSDICDPSSRREIDKITAKLRAGELKNYVTHHELAAFNYLPRTPLGEALAGEFILPDDLSNRLFKMEREVSKPGGAYTRMEKSLKSLHEKKKGSTVSAGGYNFKDSASCNASI